jgi:hypothetical protein
VSEDWGGGGGRMIEKGGKGGIRAMGKEKRKI